MLFACSDEGAKTEATQDSQPLTQKPKLELESNDDHLTSIMDKIQPMSCMSQAHKARSKTT